MFPKIKSFLLLMGMMVLTAHASYAQTPPALTPTTPEKSFDQKEMDNVVESLSFCARKKLHTERLHCYDKLAVDMNLINAEEFDKIEREIAQFGFWKLKIQQLTTNNEQSVSLIIEANQTVDSGNGFPVAPILTVRCSYGKTDVILDWKRPLTTARRPAKASKFPFFIEYRFDNNNKIASEWQLSFDNRGIFAPDPIQFVKDAIKSEQLVVNLTPAVGGLTTVSFTLKGVKEGASELSKICYKGVKPPAQKEAPQKLEHDLIYKK